MYLIDTCVSAQNIGNKDRFRHHEEAIKSNNNQFSSVQSLNRVQLSATSWTAAHQTSLSITNQFTATYVY